MVRACAGCVLLGVLFCAACEADDSGRGASALGSDGATDTAADALDGAADSPAVESGADVGFPDGVVDAPGDGGADSAIDVGADAQDAMAGDASDAGEAGDASGAAPAICAALVEAQCGHVALCTPTVFDVGTLGAARCREVLLEPCLKLATAPGAVAEQMLPCVLAWQTLPCTAFDTAPVCAAVGTRPDGNACLYPTQCASGFCRGGPAACGACAPMPALGASCSSGTDCGEILRCDGTRCVAAGIPGDPCSSSASCARSLDCDVATSTCQPYPGVGQPCTGLCDLELGLACDVGDGGGLCVTPSVSLVGGSCSGLAQRCVSSAGCYGGVCGPLAKLGEACNDATGPRCDGALGWMCKSGACAPLPAPVCP